MPEQKIILKYTKKYFQYAVEEAADTNPTSWPGAQELLAAYDRFEQGIADIEPARRSNPYCVNKFLFYGELLTAFTRGEVRREDLTRAGLDLTDFDAFTAQCLGTLIEAINNGEYDDAEAEVEKDPEKGGKFVRRKRIGIGMCWLEYNNGTFMCRAVKAPNSLVKGTYASIKYTFESDGIRTLDWPLWRTAIYSLPVSTHTFIVFEANVAAQTKLGFLVSDTRVTTVELPQAVLDKFECKTDPNDRQYPNDGMNYYFPLYYGYNRDLLKNQYPGGYTPPVLYDYAYDVHAYLPFVSAPINLSILKDMGTDQLNGSYWVSSAGVPVLANVYADMPLLVSKGTRTKSGDTDTSTYMITDERSSYSFHFGSPAYIGFALGKTGTALAAWCKEEFPRLKSVAIAAESSGDGFRSTSSTYSSSISASWDTRIYVGSCNGSIGSLTADYTVDDIVYNKTSGLSDQSLGEKYKYPFVFVQQDPVYSKQKRLPDVPPNEDYNVYTGVNIFHNAALVGLSPNPLDRDNYVADGWVWNSTFTQVESKSPKSRIISKLQRPFRALDWVQPSNLFYDYIVEPEYISGCQSTSRLERTHSDFESAGDFIFATESVAYSGHRGDQCLCTINGEKGYTKKYKSYARYGFLIPGFCYTGVNISYVKYLKQLGFETGDLVFPPIDDL